MTYRAGAKARKGGCSEVRVYGWSCRDVLAGREVKQSGTGWPCQQLCASLTRVGGDGVARIDQQSGLIRRSLNLRNQLVPEREEVARCFGLSEPVVGIGARHAGADASQVLCFGGRSEPPLPPRLRLLARGAKIALLREAFAPESAGPRAGPEPAVVRALDFEDMADEAVGPPTPSPRPVIGSRSGPVAPEAARRGVRALVLIAPALGFAPQGPRSPRRATRSALPPRRELRAHPPLLRDGRGRRGIATSARAGDRRDVGDGRERSVRGVRTRGGWRPVTARRRLPLPLDPGRRSRAGRSRRDDRGGCASGRD